MDEATGLLSKLKSTEPLRQQEKIISQLIKLVIEINEDDDDTDECAVQEAIMQSEAMDLLLTHLQDDLSQEKESLLAACCQLVAELAKTETLREPLVNRGFMPQLLRHLPSTNIALATQSCRALGNICYDNDLGRSAVDKENGIPTILNMLSKQIENSEEGAARLRIIVCGFLLNLTNNCELLQDKAIDNGVLDLLNDTISRHLDDEDLTNMALLTVGSITEADSGKAAASRSGLLDTLKMLLDRESSVDLTEMILELLTGIMESEPAKEMAAENGLCKSLVSLIQSESLSPEVVKMASDVFISVLVGDDSMEKLYASGEGQLFLQSVEWLSSDKDHLKTLGSLAIGNFARRDAYCQQLVENGILEKLISILKSNIGPEASFTLQHAVLSTLRNLAIPVSNKPKLQAAGVMDACLTLIHSEVMAVVFKLLGVLRMLIEGQEAAAMKLGQERTFLECLAEWCSVEAHAGVKGEATRVMASLVKNSRSTAVIQNLIRAEGLVHLVAMATSEHLVMQNEAVMALTIICSVALGEAAVSLKEAGLSSTVLTLLKEQTLPSEMVINVLSLLKAVTASGNLREEIVSSGVVDQVRSLAEGHGDVKVKEQARSALNIMEESMSTG
ncbi:rap1 GTPase-GDP dissociation stimulator 1 isoform X2 [Aplysia californica]|uniref:Rap1 GTPase-GDP dissociation stimulator 1 isoform X2 n=1 Tax=Aplysia californica TaxID=6500 RepID=A0ABM0K9X5_APLCA|nr:rap1 GTPase-GDP dissociation stimulator 1 isoform X2 [Aplysia californica]